MNLALFDFDGTVTSSDTWTPFMRFAVRPVRLIAWIPFIPFVVGHKLQLVSASRVRQLAVRVGFQGDEASRVRRLGVEYALTVLPKTVRQTAIDRMEWHERQGDRVVVVSGSLDVYLGPWCNARGTSYICTTLDERNGRLTGKCLHGDCVGSEKARRISERFDLSRYPIIYAYGDSAEDREMLELAHKKYFRWKEISGWHEVASDGHPSESSVRDGGQAG